MLKRKNEKLPKISVIIPSFNKAKYIAKTLNSIVKQGYPFIEILIQDGGSNDGTVDIIKSFAKKYPKTISWVSGKDNGQLDAVNKGMQKAKGDLLTFINADDFYSPGAFWKVANSFRKDKSVRWFAGRGIVINSHNEEIAKPVTFYKNLLLKINNRNMLLMTNYLIQPSVFFTRDLFIRFGPFKGTRYFIMEYDLWLNFSKECMPVIVNENLTNFRIEATTKTKTMFKQILKEDEAIAQEHTKNFLIIFLHKLNNFGRILIGRFV